MNKELIKDFEYQCIDQTFIENNALQMKLGPDVIRSIQNQLNAATKHSMWLYYLQLKYKGRVGYLYTLMNPEMADDPQVSVELYLKEIAQSWAEENWRADEFE